MFAEKGVRLEEAEGLIKRALEIDGDNGAFLDSLGWTFHQLGRHQEAEELLDRAVRAEIARKADGEGLAVIWDHIGDNARALGKTRKALEAWGHALRATPGDRKIEAKLQAMEKAPRKP
jgi:tetratricopeptide (TPR) repeat protein